MTYKEISDQFNELGRKTTRGKKFFPTSVHSLEKKMDNRIERTTRVFPININDVDIVFEELLITEKNTKNKEITDGETTHNM